ncbi:restriction endonuclease subunit S [Vibrio parahaemolyticus]|nr:restriction endonuclease subunit S [Vibrio parahaemolyticus]
MSCNWPIQKLGDLCKEITVGYVGSMTKEYVDDGVPFFRSKNISEYQINWDDIKYVSPEFHQKLKKSSLSSGDVAIVRTGKPGTCCVIPEDVAEANCSDIVIARVDESKLCAHYLSFFMNSIANHQVSSRLVGAVQQHFNVSAAKQIEIPLPSRSEQTKIVHVLKTISDKISLNIRTNHTLEEMAQTIFKSWFVDFDPVKAKMNGEQPEGMDAATASLFPEKLVESELGLIPEGWEVGTLDSHTSMIIDHRGKTPKKLGSDWVEEGYPAISAKNIKSKKIVRPDTIRFIDEATYKKWMKEPLIKGDIIMTSEAPMGELYFFDGSEDFCLSQRLYGLRANSNVCSPEFLFNWLQTTKAKADMEGRASGTTALGIKQAELRKVKILTPPLELLEKYSAVASNLVDMAAKNNAQNTVLEDLRDTLLPKLLSGEIELGQAQELAEVE